MNTPFSILDESIVFIYFLIVLGIGFWFFSKRNKTAEEFMDGGRSFSGGVAGVSLFATWMSNLGMVSLPALAFRENWAYLVTFLSAPLCGWLTQRYVVPVFRKEGSISAFTFMGNRLGQWTAKFSTILHFFGHIARLTFIVYLASVALKYITGWDEMVVILIVGSVVILYSYLGGLRAIIWTDVVQVALFTVSLVVFIVFVWNAFPGSLAEAVRMGYEEGKFSLGSFSLSLRNPTFWVLLVYGFASNLEGFFIGPEYVQRYMASRSEADAKKCAWISSWMLLVCSLLLFFAGSLLFAFFKAKGAPEGLKEGFVFMYFIGEYMPAGLKGLMVVGILSMAMSSVDSALNGLAMLYVIHFRRKSPEIAKPGELGLLCSLSILIGTIPILIAFGMLERENLLEVWNTIDALFGAQRLGLFLMALFFVKFSRGNTIISLVIGCIVILWMTFSPKWGWCPVMLQSTFSELLTFVVGILAMLGSAFVLARLNKDRGIHFRKD